MQKDWLVMFVMVAIMLTIFPLMVLLWFIIGGLMGLWPLPQ